MAPTPRRPWKRFGLALIVAACVAGLLLGAFETFRRPPAVVVVPVVLLVCGVGATGVIDTAGHHRAAGDSWPQAVVHGIGDGLRFIVDALL